MPLTESIADLLTGGQLTEAEQAINELREVVQTQAGDNFQLSERLAELELALEDIGWIRMLAMGEQEFSRSGYMKLTKICRLMALKNPLIARSIEVQAYYVWAQGVSIKAACEAVDSVVQDYMAERGNRKELFSKEANLFKDRELGATGNIFLAHYVNFANGKVRTRSIPFEEIVDIIKDPNDDKKPLYYKREWNYKVFDYRLPQGVSDKLRQAWYPDYHNFRGQHPPAIGGVEVISDVYIQHKKDGGFEHWDFGVPWIYAAVDWAKAYKEFLEDTASIWRAYKRFAMQLKTKGGKKGVQKVKDKMQTTLSIDQIEHNPPPVTGSMFVSGEGKELSVIRTAGATTSPSDARQLLLMVCASAGLPETFYGDVSTGNLATATSLDRPTELKFLMRQAFWEEILRDALEFVVDRAADAVAGPLAGEVIENQWGDYEVVLPDDPETGEPMSRNITFTWPAIIHHDISEVINSIVAGATLNGQPAQGIMTKRTLSTLILSALPGVSDITGLVDEIYPDDTGDEPAGELINKAATGEAVVPEPADDGMNEALRNLKETIEKVGARYAASLAS